MKITKIVLLSILLITTSACVPVYDNNQHLLLSTVAANTLMLKSECGTPQGKQRISQILHDVTILKIYTKNSPDGKNFSDAIYIIHEDVEALLHKYQSTSEKFCEIQSDIIFTKTNRLLDTSSKLK